MFARVLYDLIKVKYCFDFLFVLALFLNDGSQICFKLV